MTFLKQHYVLSRTSLCLSHNADASLTELWDDLSRTHLRPFANITTTLNLLSACGTMFSTGVKQEYKQANK